MSDYLMHLVEKHQSKGVLVDSNLLLLYFVGMHDPAQIPKFKRTMAYRVEDFELLSSFLSLFQTILTTPNILTEVSNLSAQMSDTIRLPDFTEFQEQLLVLQEHYVASRAAGRERCFARFGLTDAALTYHIASTKGLLLTDDLRLAYFLEHAGYDVINFTHLRSWS